MTTPLKYDPVDEIIEDALEAAVEFGVAITRRPSNQEEINRRDEELCRLAEVLYGALGSAPAALKITQKLLRQARKTC